ncbi:MAG: DedA family protein [Magnetococcales bacterium]|nr:DedA family protein [Magnetococcales bacterium]
MLDWGLGGLFVSALLAATILPLSSEAVLAGLYYSADHDPRWLWLVATAGNVGGSMVNWYLGRETLRWQHEKWFPLQAEQLHAAQSRYLKWGRWSLLLAWVPVIGDPLTYVAGLFRTPLLFFTVLVFMGKGGRYLLLLWVLSGE